MNRMKKVKPFLSMLITLCLTVSLLPMQVLAAKNVGLLNHSTTIVTEAEKKEGYMDASEISKRNVVVDDPSIVGSDAVKAVSQEGTWGC